MALTTHLGFGRFQLADFQPGELFARFDGTLAKVADPQPPGRPDHILVWNNHEPAMPSGSGCIGRRSLTPSRRSRPG